MCPRHKVLPKCMIWSRSMMRKNGHISTACIKQSNKNKTHSQESKHLHLQTTNFWEAGPKGEHYSILRARLGHVQEKGTRKHASKRWKGRGREGRREGRRDGIWLYWFPVLPNWVKHNSRPEGHDPGCWTQYTHSICSRCKHFSVSYKAVLCFSKRVISIWKNAKILHWPFNLCILTFYNNSTPLTQEIDLAQLTRTNLSYCKLNLKFKS